SSDLTSTTSRFFHRGYLLSIKLPLFLILKTTTVSAETVRVARLCSGFYIFNSAFRQGRSHGDFLHWQLYAIGHFNHDEIVSHFGDLAQHATCSHHFIAFGQARDQIFVFFLTLALR